jgi:hypothetical protein
MHAIRRVGKKWCVVIADFAHCESPPQIIVVVLVVVTMNRDENDDEDDGLRPLFYITTLSASSNTG